MRRHNFLQIAGAGLCSALLLAACNGSGSSSKAAATSVAAKSGWTGAWSTALYGPFPNGPLTDTLGGLSTYTDIFTNNEASQQSFRMIIHPTLGGERVRACFANFEGDRPLELTSASIAKSLSPTPAIVPGSAVSLLFAGQPSVKIPAGEKRCSDGADFSYAYGDDLAISFYAPGPTGPITWHPEAFAASYVSLPGIGDVTSDPTGLLITQPSRSWFFLSDLDVMQADTPSVAITTFGDSITDGSYGTPLLNHRYPDFLAARIQAAGLPVGVRNQGINGNTVTAVRSGPVTGRPGVERFSRDALSSGVKGVFVLLGTNDLGSDAPAADVYKGLLELARQAHAAGRCIVVSTILPRNDPSPVFGWDPATNGLERKALNEMILSSKVFDGVADVASVMANPLLPDQPFQPYFVEGLHPNSVGMKVLADAIPIEPLLPPPYGSCTR